MKPILSLLVLAFSCAPADVEVSPNVIRSTVEARINATDLVTVEMTYPVDAQGRFLKSKMPALVFIPGGFVKPEEYRWQADELAKSGIVVAVVQQVADLAFFSINNAEAARKLLTSAPYESFVNADNIVVAGHSLGGVVAIKLALKYSYSKLVVQASFADTADVATLKKFSKPTLFMAGELDCQAALSTIKSAYESFPTPVTLAVFSGATHYQFTNSDAPDVKKNCNPTTDIATSHAHMNELMFNFIKDLPLKASAGVTLESR
jgi:pimeloyl-ACP methyl ester carboxylesterase